MIIYPPPPRLTDAQRDVLAVILGYARHWPMPPTLEQIGAHLGRAANTVHSTVKRLESLGFVTRVPKVTRGRSLTSLGLLAAQGYWPAWWAVRH